ncbi:MAG: hypothetical protein KJ638_12220, partial [Chloroflexi bacterium]|nr:hypothetical protein [Chloroflexota bacterium]
EAISFSPRTRLLHSATKKHNAMSLRADAFQRSNLLLAKDEIAHLHCTKRSAVQVSAVKLLRNDRINLIWRLTCDDGMAGEMTP